MPTTVKNKPKKGKIIAQSKNSFLKRIGATLHSNTVFYFLFIYFLLTFVAGGGYLLVKSNEEAAANFADYVLRPKIGTKMTVGLEALFFGLEDNVNKAKYSLVKPKAPKFFTFGAIPGQVLASETNEFTLDPIHPLFTFSGNTLKGEGQWTPLTSDGKDVLLAKTFLRPDADRAYAIVSLVKMNMNKLNLHNVAGKIEPGGVKNPGPGMVPADIQQDNNLLAAFNGGFQGRDGNFGMVSGDKTYLPLIANMATLVIYKDTHPRIIKYAGQSLGDGVVGIRQNGPLLIENSQLVASSSAWNMQTWGLTTTNSMYTWRSGIGVTKDGNLVYACGPSLVPQTLASALLAAGAVNAMQLDINSTWVRFVLFNSSGNGQYKYLPLEASMINGGYEYLHGYQRDFFYLYKK